jgi:hypothetical protein
MDYAERQEKIVEYLKIKSTTHGQIYTFQIAVPSSASKEISPERFEAISHSLTQQGTNLIPLIVRRTEAYSEEEEYEVVEGVDWYLVAKEIGIEKLWVWVFNMTDEEVQISQQEMALLLGKNVAPSSDEVTRVKQIQGSSDLTLEDQFNQQFSQLNRKIELRFKHFEEEIIHTLEDKLHKYLPTLVEKITVEIKNSLLLKGESSSDKKKNKPLSSCTKEELKRIAKEKGLKKYSNLRKDQLIDVIAKAEQQSSSVE